MRYAAILLGLLGVGCISPVIDSTERDYRKLPDRPAQTDDGVVEYQRLGIEQIQRSAAALEGQRVKTIAKIVTLPVEGTALVSDPEAHVGLEPRLLLRGISHAIWQQLDINQVVMVQGRVATGQPDVVWSVDAVIATHSVTENWQSH